MNKFSLLDIYVSRNLLLIVIENNCNHDGFAAWPPIYISGDIVAINLETFFALTSSRVVRDIAIKELDPGFAQHTGKLL